MKKLIYFSILLKDFCTKICIDKQFYSTKSRVPYFIVNQEWSQKVCDYIQKSNKLDKNDIICLINPGYSDVTLKILEQTNCQIQAWELNLDYQKHLQNVLQNYKERFFLYPSQFFSRIFLNNLKESQLNFIVFGSFNNTGSFMNTLLKDYLFRYGFFSNDKYNPLSFLLLVDGFEYKLMTDCSNMWKTLLNLGPAIYEVYFDIKTVFKIPTSALSRHTINVKSKNMEIDSRNLYLLDIKPSLKCFNYLKPQKADDHQKYENYLIENNPNSIEKKKNNFYIDSEEALKKNNSNYINTNSNRKYNNHNCNINNNNNNFNFNNNNYNCNINNKNNNEVDYNFNDKNTEYGVPLLDTSKENKKEKLKKREIEAFCIENEVNEVYRRDAIGLWYLLKYINKRRSARVIPLFEKLCDGVGLNLLSMGLSMMDTIPKVPLQLWPQIYLAMVAHENFENSSLEQIISPEDNSINSIKSKKHIGGERSVGVTDSDDNNVTKEI